MLRLALVQMDVKWADPASNLVTAHQMIIQAATDGADLVVLPELWGCGYDLAHAAKYATSIGGGLFAEMARLARELDLHVMGSLLEESEGKFYNTCALFGPQGLAGHYRKLHRFRLMDEDRYLAPGNKPALIQDLLWGTTALAICYDLRFPELFRAYAVAGARLIVIPAQWPAPRIDHWRTLLQARAIENQCFVAGCNRVGTDPNNAFGGASTVIGPWGEVLVEGDDAPGLFLADVDLKEVDKVRQHIPVLSDRRPEHYAL